MPVFRCYVINPQGKRVRLTRQSSDIKECTKELLSQGFTPIQIRSGSKTLLEILNSPVNIGSGRTGNPEQALLLRQLSILITADLPLDRSLDLLRDQTNSSRQRQTVQEILNDIRSGHSLAQAIEPRHSFPTWVTGIIRSTEGSGDLGGALRNAADRMAAIVSTRRNLASALTYPATILAATIMALILILTLVIPQFEPIFAGAEGRLPALTQFILYLTHKAQSWWLTLAIAVTAVTTVALAFLGSAAGGRFRESYARLIPGQRLRDQYLTAQFSGLFATLILNGVTVVKALTLTRDAIGSSRWQRHLDLIISKLKEGTRLSVALSGMQCFPDTARRLVEVGEQTGKLGASCQEASKIMEEISRQRIENIVSLVNPVAIMLLGGVVAILVAGVMLGIFALGDFTG